ncbi:MAG TPA: SDR family oxidoreductase [Pedobacter sp.]|uniref:SDR family NAD(P)-dependent oxidoreductase n=1 Tax=Pedobacter sp. TaxID=1411316 RepID=UPI002BC1A6B5|nr:SDR family oxidoreductase [Pedobacter sp.]HMI01210.1 SDR family oxidoreductase [Pedobacter sp.]
MDKYALVTGASKGIGREIAILLAEKGYNLLLVARAETELQQLSQQLVQQHQVKVHFLLCDLAEPGAATKVSNWFREITSSLSVLINNAGYGAWGNFNDLKLETQMNMLQLNVNAVVELTYLLLPDLKQQDTAYILNVASTAAYQAMPTMALYAASKSFILSFSRALRYELLKTPVSVSCLSPGPTATGFVSRAGLEALADLADKFNMSPTAVARIGLKGMFNKKAEIIPGFINKVSVFGATHLPKSLIERITAGLYKH